MAGPRRVEPGQSWTRTAPRAPARRPACAIVWSAMSTSKRDREIERPDLAIPDGERIFTAIELRTTDDADLVEILLRLREAGAEIVTINTFPATKKGEGEDITRVFDIELRDLDSADATRIAESVPGVRVAGSRPTLGQIFGKRVIIVGGGAQVAQVALGAVSESDRHNLRGERISVDTMALVGEENIAAAVRAVADLPRAHILVLAGSLMGGEITEGRPRAARDRHPRGLAEHGRLRVGRGGPRRERSGAGRHDGCHGHRGHGALRPGQARQPPLLDAAELAARGETARAPIRPGQSAAPLSLRHDRHQPHHPRPLAGDALASPGPLLPAGLGTRRGPPPLRRRWPRLPRLRQRHRGDLAGPRPPARQRGHPCPGRPAPARLQRPGPSGAGDAPGGDDRGGDAGRAGHGLLRQLRSGGRGRCPQARPPCHGPQPHHRVQRGVPRTDVRRHQRHDVQPELPHRLRPDVAGRPHRALPVCIPRLRWRRGGRQRLRAREPRAPLCHRRAALAHGGLHHRAGAG